MNFRVVTEAAPSPGPKGQCHNSKDNKPTTVAFEITDSRKPRTAKISEKKKKQKRKSPGMNPPNQEERNIWDLGRWLIGKVPAIQAQGPEFGSS